MTGHRTIQGRKAELATLSEFGCETAGISETQFVAPLSLRGSIFSRLSFSDLFLCARRPSRRLARVKKANRPPAFQLSTVWPCSSYVSSMHSNYY